jgi:hypothetical protein
MRTTKLGAVLASLALSAGTTAVLAAAPAHAATAAATATKVALDMSGHHQVKGVYGDYLGTLGGSVTFKQTDGSSATVTDGDAILQRRLPGRSWKGVKTDSDPSYLYFGTYGSHAHGNVKYRVHYLGGTGTGTDGSTYTWAPAFSNVVTVGTYWDLNDSGSCVGGCHLSGKLAPKAPHHKVTIQVKHGTWKRYKVVHTTSRSKYRAGVQATRGKGTKYRILVAGTKNLLQTKSIIYRAVRY